MDALVRILSLAWTLDPATVVDFGLVAFAAAFCGISCSPASSWAAAGVILS